MRIFVVPKPDTDLQALSQQLLRRSGAGSATLDRLKALNPHVDFQRLKAGTVLLVPDAADVKAGATTTVGGEEVRDFLEEIDSGIKAVVKHVRAGVERLDADRSAITSALKGAAARRVIDSDSILLKQLAAAGTQFKTDQKRAAEAQSQLADAHKLATKELAELQKLLDS